MSSRHRRGALAVLAALIAAACVLTVLSYGSGAHRSADPARPRTSPVRSHPSAKTGPPRSMPSDPDVVPGSSRPAAGWVQVLANLDAVRAQAYATRRPQLLSHVYLPGALLRRDTAQLVTLVPTGCGLTGALTRYRSTATVREGTHTVLIVDADLPATTLVCDGAVRASAPGRAARLRVELVDTKAGPRIASQSPA